MTNGLSEELAGCVNDGLALGQEPCMGCQHAQHLLYLVPPTPLVNSSCLGASPELFGFFNLFHLNQKVKQKSPLCYLYLASNLSLIFKDRPLGSIKFGPLLLCLGSLWIIRRKVITDNLPKKHSWANYPFDMQNVCLLQSVLNFSFSVLTKIKTPNLCYQ